MNKSKSKYLTKEWLIVSIPILSIALMQLLVRSTDTIILGFFHGTAVSGPYSVANRIALLAAFGLMAINAVLPPLISSYYTNKKIKELQSIVTLSARLNFGFSLFSTLMIILLHEYILNLFGLEFKEASSALIVLCAGQVINALTGSVGFVLSMT